MAAQEELVPSRLSRLVGAADDLREELTMQVWQQQADRLAPVHDESASRGIRRVLQLVRDGQNPCPGRFLYLVAFVEGPGDRGDRHARLPGDIFDVGPHALERYDRKKCKPLHLATAS